LGVGLSALAGSVWAQALPHNLRGTVKSLTADTLVLQPKSGPAVKVQLTPAWGVTAMKSVAVDAIQTGSFIGTTTYEKPDGTGRSLEVHVFPPGVKIGQGHYPWDLKPHSMMTNGDVGKVVAGRKGRTIEVAYPGGTHTIMVPNNVPVVTITPGDRAMVKPGVKVFIMSTRSPDGRGIDDGAATSQRQASVQVALQREPASAGFVDDVQPDRALSSP